ncbi:MAG: PAS domain-containing protein [Verrucomicrobiota bacterium]
MNHTDEPEQNPPRDDGQAKGIPTRILEPTWDDEPHRLSEARLQAILDNTTAVIYLKDRTGRYLLVNRQFEELFQVTRAQIIEKTAYDLFPRELADALQANDHRVLESLSSLQFEEVVALQSGERRTYVSVKFPLCNSAGRPYAICGISTDITERKQMETQLLTANRELLHTNGELARSADALRQALADLQMSHAQLQDAQKKLIEASKMESIGRMAANVAHEVKNPLQTILMGLAYVSKAAPGQDDNFKTAVSCMREAVRRADAIVRDLLYLSAAQELELKEEDLNAILASSLSMVNLELTQARILIVRQLAEALPLVRADRARLEQVFINLFLNAIQAMSHGGTLTVQTRPLQLEADADPPGQLRGTFRPGDLLAVVEIRDTGNGIAPDKMNRIFEPFFTTKPSGVGTGLGLPVSKQLVALHGGIITIEPATPRGLKVNVTLKAL